MKNFIYMAMLLFLLTASCRKPKTDANGLPPATQTGANTFGCLVNGVPWTPEGRGPIGQPNIRLWVDPTYIGGQLLIEAFKYQGYDLISVGAYGCKNVGTYFYRPYNDSVRVQFETRRGTDQCFYFSDPGKYRQGNFTVTKYDLANGIFSGTFDVTIAMPTANCGDTIRITHGRFDLKL